MKFCYLRTFSLTLEHRRATADVIVAGFRNLIGGATRLLEKGAAFLWNEYRELDTEARSGYIFSSAPTIKSSDDDNSRTAVLHGSSPNSIMVVGGSHRRTHSLQGTPGSGTAPSSLPRAWDSTAAPVNDPRSSALYCHYSHESQLNPTALTCACRNASTLGGATNCKHSNCNMVQLQKCADSGCDQKCVGLIRDGEDVTTKTDVKSEDVSCTRIFIYTTLVIAIICCALFVGRDYIRYVLLSLESANVAVGVLIFVALFTAVSFPMTWGYILLNVAAGYLYGVPRGVAVVMVCATCGILCAHIVIRRFLRDFVWDRISNDTMRAVLRVVESASGFKVIVLARLTPIPFGLQNALFAVSGNL